MTKTLSFSAFVMNTASHIIHGLWRSPDGNQIDFNNIEVWIDLAKKLEAGGFDNLFFADVVGLYHPFKGSTDFHLEKGFQVPSNDPSALIAALAVKTEHLGLAFTASPVQEPPFNFARRISTLDHISNGRVAWNIVTGYLENGFKNFGYDHLVTHDERYNWGEEYLEVLYKLWEGSWEEDALEKNRETGVYANPAKVHKINHVGNRYKVEGPHLVSPSPQRTPVLFQAGASTRGKRFAAKHAEATFIISPSPEAAKKAIEETRKLAVEFGRNPEDIKFYQGLSFVVGATEEEARRKSEELDKYVDLEVIIAHFAGSIGIDFGNAHLDTPLGDIKTEGIQSLLDWVRESTGNREATVRDLALYQSRISRIVGTPEQIANVLEKWAEAGVDGINVVNFTIPGTYVDFIEHVIPVLRERGLAKPQQQEPTTFRKKIFGTDRLNDRHPGSSYKMGSAVQS